MVKIKYVGPLGAITIPGAGNVDRGDEIEVSDKLAEDLKTQRPEWWKLPTAKKPSKRDQDG